MKFAVNRRRWRKRNVLNYAPRNVREETAGNKDDPKG